MEELALHILDIAENSIAAGARHVDIRVSEDLAADRLTVEIRDNGRGMAEQVLRRAADPFFTTKGTRPVGLGLSLLEQAARAAGGSLRIQSRPGAGATVTAEFRHSHPDRQPLGDVAATLLDAGRRPSRSRVFLRTLRRGLLRPVQHGRLEARTGGRSPEQPGRHLGPGDAGWRS